MNIPNYENYLQRSVIEDNGNTRLYWDNNGFLSNSYNENNKRLTSPYKDFPEISGEHIRKSWWGRKDWDFHAAEFTNNTLKIFLRARLDISTQASNQQNDKDFSYIEIWELDENGNFIGMEYPERDNSNDRAFYYNIKSDRQAIADYNVQWFSDLETWLLSDKDLRDAYFSETGSRNQPKSSGRLEDYAFEQWNIRNPEETPPNSNGIKELTGDYNKNEQGINKLMAPSKYKSKTADKITNFNPSVDTLEIDTDSFGIDNSATFAAGKNKKEVKKKLAKQDFDFLYDQKKGGLYFNENGADKGFGDGGIVAILKGAPDLTSGNLEFA